MYMLCDVHNDYLEKYHLKLAYVSLHVHVDAGMSTHVCQYACGQGLDSCEMCMFLCDALCAHTYYSVCMCEQYMSMNAY